MYVNLDVNFRVLSNEEKAGEIQHSYANKSEKIASFEDFENTHILDIINKEGKIYTVGIYKLVKYVIYVLLYYY